MEIFCLLLLSRFPHCNFFNASATKQNIVWLQLSPVEKTEEVEEDPKAFGPGVLEDEGQQGPGAFAPGPTEAPPLVLVAEHRLGAGPYWRAHLALSEI